MKYITATLIVCSFLFCLPLPAQDDGYDPSLCTQLRDGYFTPASPEAAAMVRYGSDAKPDYRTGTIGVTIPVYTYKDHDFEIPVSLCYGSSGYQPGMDPGAIGNGWYLSCGGSITREVRGLPDESKGRICSPKDDDGNVAESIAHAMALANMSYWSIKHAIFQYNQVNDTKVDGYARRHLIDELDEELVELSDTIDFAYTNELGSEFLMCSRISGYGYVPNTFVEMEPDIYHYSFLGNTGTFILQPKGQVLIMETNSPSGNVEITYHWTDSLPLDGTYFTISFGDGYKYDFDCREETHSFNDAIGEDNGNRSIGSWKLSRITAPNGRTVQFGYLPNSQIHQTSYQTGINIDHTTMYHQGHNPTYLWQSQNPPSETVTITNTVQPCLIQNISVSGGSTISFTYESEVGNGGHRRYLNTIEVRNSTDRLVRSCTFTANSVTGSQVRFLKSVSIPGQGMWNFDYIGENSLLYNHAEDMAWETDWGGYFNGLSFKNTITGSNSTTMPSKAATIKAARQPSLSNSSLTMLSRITWPTGGKTEFSYGQNSYKYVCSLPGMTPEPVPESSTYGLRLSTIDNYDNDGNQLQHISYTYDKGALLRKPMVYFNYTIGSTNLSFNREVVNTMSNIGYGKDSHIVYDKVVEKISRTASSPATETATNEYEYYGPGEGETCVCAGENTTLPWTFADWNYLLTDFGSEWDIFQNWTRGLYSGQLKHVTNYKGTSSGPVIVSRQTNTCDSYVQKWVADTAALYNRTPYVEWPSVWKCFTQHCIIVRPRSSYLSHTEKQSFNTQGDSLFRIPTTYIVDALGRHTRRQTIDSQGNSLSTDLQYLSQTPYVQSVTERRNNSLISRKGFTYTERSGVTGTYYRPATITRTASVNGSAGQTQTVTAFTQFDQFNNVTCSEDALGNKTEYTWDSSGQYLTSLKRYPGGNPGPALTTTWNWIPLVGVSSVTTPGGKTVRYYYDSYGRLTGIGDTANNTLKQYYYYITDAQNDYSWTESRTFRTATNHADDVTYYNGLGYPVMTRGVDPSAGYDTGTIISYDALMREDRKWLPAAFENLDFTESEWAEFFLPADYDVLTYYQDLYGSEPEPDEDPVPVRPFSDIVSEFSPSGRQLSVSLPGEQYYLHPTSYDYLAAVIDGRNVTGVKTTDGDGRISIEWKDYEDRVVALDRHTGDTTARTLFRYDWRGNLTEVITPNGSRYLYTYDTHSRMTSRTIPGKAVETFAYDALDRVISSQDGNQRANGVTIRYYYDNIGNLTSKKAEKNNVLRTLEEYTYSTTTGLKTSERFYRLTADGWVDPYDYISRTYTYDNEERVTGMVETDDAETYSLTTAYTYDLLGNVTRTVETSSLESGSTVAVTTERQYDSRSRPTSETVKIGNATKSTVSFYYDELGRPDLKLYGTGADRIYEYLAYTIQGWLSYRGGNLLTQYYDYENSSSPGWTGNITRWNWHHVPTSAENTTYPSLSETFTYDALNRLTGSSMSSNGQSAGNCWSERNVSYDLVGNILHLDRYQDVSSTPSTTLNFSYSGNQRSGYSYDNNGNVTYDPIRNFEIRYNLLNLASEVRIPEVGGDSPQPAIDLSETVYYADGTRAGVEDPDTGYWISRYIGSLIYSGENGEESLDGIQTADGFIEWNGSATNAQMQYFLRDHLGSVRVIATDKNNVLSRTDYLPFGVRMTGNGLPESTSERSAWFGFSGKENEMWGSGPRGERYQHFGARAYDPLTCIFMQIDPMAESYYNYSTYSFCFGNPTNYIDPIGEKIIFINGYPKKWTGACGTGGAAYWNSTGKFVNAAQRTFNDYKSFFPNIDYRLLSSAKKRRKDGYSYARDYYADITGDLAEGEKIRFVSHSMGAAFAEGMADYLIEQGVSVDVLIHFEPYQAADIESNGSSPNILTIDYQDTRDIIIKYSFMAGGNMPGADDHIRVDSNADLQYVHAYSISHETSWNDIISIIEAFLNQ